MSDDNSSSIELNRRRVLGALGTVGVASAGAGAGTFALFSDTETSSGNSVQAGTLDLTPSTTQSFNASATNLAPGDQTNRVQIQLDNDGSLSGEHVEIGVGFSENDGGEPADGGLSNDVSAGRFAKRLFATEFNFPIGNGIGFGPETFETFIGDQTGAAVIDFGDDGASDVSLNRVPDPAGGSRQDVVLATSDGTPTSDYAISMRSVSGVPIDSVSSGDITFDYYGGPSNSNSAPDEVYVIVNDSSGTDRLVYHAGNDSSPAAETWNTRDVGAEIAGETGALNSGFSWFEISPDGSNSYSKPNNNEGLASDLDGTIEAIGFGRGTIGGGDTLEVYYDNLVVDGTTYEFRPVSLYDLSNRGVFDSLAGIPSGGSKTFEARFQLDRLAGNALQGDGVDINFTFGLAQDSGQSVL